MKASEDEGYRAAIVHHPNDWKWADWLHTSLETYAVPGQFVGQKIDNRTIPKRLFPIFRARDDMPLRSETGSTPSEQRAWALRNSEALIVIGSPDAAKSVELDGDVRAFRESNPDRPIICIIAPHDTDSSNTPGDSAKECLPPSIWKRPDGQETDREPFVFDIARDRLSKRTIALKTMSAVLRLGYDDLKQRDHERAQQRLRVILAGVLVLFVVFLGLAVQLYFKTRVAETTARSATQEAERHKRSFITVQRQLNESAAALAEANKEIERLKRELNRKTPTAQAEPNWPPPILLSAIFLSRRSLPARPLPSHARHLARAF